MTPLVARQTRAKMIRRRLIAGALSLFLAMWLLIAVVLVSGHDPALAARKSSVATVATASTPATTSTASTPTTTTTSSTPTATPTTTTTSAATPSASSSSGTSSVTTRQS